MLTKFWIEKAWGDQVENVIIHDVHQAIAEMIKMDEEHGAFWIGNYEDENVLEVHQDLRIFFASNDEVIEQLSVQLGSWTEVTDLFQRFLNKQFQEIRSFIKAKNELRL